MNELWVVLAAVINAVVLAFISRRLLGVPVGWPRTVVVSLLVAWVFGQLVEVIERFPGVDIFFGGRGLDFAVTVDTPAALLVLTLALAWSFGLGLALLVALEAIVPTGTLPGVLPWLRGLPARWRRSRRYAQIVAIASQHGLGGYLRGYRRTTSDEPPITVARHLREALAEGGVTFVKLGQMLATRPDLIGPTFAEELAHLQADVPTVPWSELVTVIEAELGGPLDRAFAAVDPEPLAAASVAQVHTATLLDGTPVVVKVQRPKARAQVTADLDIVLRLARWANRATSWGPQIGIYGIAKGFAESLEEELDYTVELANQAAVAAGMVPGDGIRVPTVYPELSGRRLIVMERVSGVPVSKGAAALGAMDAPTRDGLARGLLRSVLRQVLVTGVFHADLHQGNIIVEPAGRLVLLDLGAVGRLDRGSRDALALLLHSVKRRDSMSATDAFLQLLDRPDDLEDRAFERDLGQLVQRYASGPVPGNSTSAGLFGAMFSLVVRHRFTVPPQVASALRALGALEGTLWSISPAVDLVTAAREEGRAVLGNRFAPSEIKASLEDQLITLVPLLTRLPRRLNAIAENLQEGRTTVNVRVLADERDRRFVTHLIQQLTVTLLAGALAVCGVILIVNETGPMMLPALRLYTFLGAALFFFAFVLAARALVLVFRHPARA